MTGRDVLDFKRQLHAASGRKPASPIMDWFDDTQYPLAVKNQARMAFETASIARHLQLDYIKEQEQLLLKARKCAENAAHLDRLIRVNEQLVIDLRKKDAIPCYALGPFFPGDSIRYDVRIAQQTPFREMPSSDADRSMPNPPKSPVDSESVSSPSVAVQNSPPISNLGWETDSDDDHFTIAYSDEERFEQPAAGQKSAKTEEKKTVVPKKSVGFKSPVNEKKELPPPVKTQHREQSTQTKKSRTNVAPAKPIKYGSDLGELTVFEWPVLPYPPGIEVRGILPGGLPEFDYKQVFAQLPPQVEINLELLTDKRLGFATRFVVDATVEVNIVQMRVLDEFSDPPTPQSRRVIYVPWAYLQAVPTEWIKQAVRVRRYTSLRGEYPPTFLLDVSVTAAKNLKPGVQILGAPFAKKYVVSYAMFDEDEGAIAVRFGNNVEWIPYIRYTPDPPKERRFPFRHTNRK